MVHGQGMLGRKIVSMACVGPDAVVPSQPNVVREILLFRKEKEIRLTMKDGGKYILDSSNICVELFEDDIA